MDDTVAFGRLTSQAGVEHTFGLRIGPGRSTLPGYFEATVSGWLSPASARLPNAYRYRPSAPQDTASPAHLFEASLTLSLAEAPCLSIETIADTLHVGTGG